MYVQQLETYLAIHIRIIMRVWTFNVPALVNQVYNDLCNVLHMQGCWPNMAVAILLDVFVEVNVIHAWAGVYCIVILIMGFTYLHSKLCQCRRRIRVPWSSVKATCRSICFYLSTEDVDEIHPDLVSGHAVGGPLLSGFGLCAGESHGNVCTVTQADLESDEKQGEEMKYLGREACSSHGCSLPLIQEQADVGYFATNQAFYRLIAVVVLHSQHVCYTKAYT